MFGLGPCVVCGKPATMVEYLTSIASSVFPAPERGRYCGEHTQYQFTLAAGKSKSPSRPKPTPPKSKPFPGARPPFTKKGK